MMGDRFSRQTFSWDAVTEAKPLVSHLMAMDRRIEKNDTLCILKFWQMYDQIEIPEQVFFNILNHASSPEVIMRARRKIAEERREAYGVTSEIEQKRLDLAKQTRMQVKQVTL